MATVDGLEALQVHVGSATINDEQADTAPILSLARGASRNDQIVCQRARDAGRLLAGQYVIASFLPGRSGDICKVEARAVLGPCQRPDLRARHDIGDKALPAGAGLLQ